MSARIPHSSPKELDSDAVSPAGSLITRAGLATGPESGKDAVKQGLHMRAECFSVSYDINAMLTVAGAKASSLGLESRSRSLFSQ